MFSPRYLAVLALVAAVSSLPAQEKPIPQPITTITNDEFSPPIPSPWFNVPFFGDITKLFAPLWKLFPSFEDLGPRILADDDKFQVVIQAKDYNKADLKVKVKGDFVFVQGLHEAKLQEDHDLFASQFFHTYTLPANSSASTVTAELTSDGFLIINAPIEGPVDRSKETDREVPIVSTGTPYRKEETVEIQTPPEPVTPAEDDSKEPTTLASEKEEVTEKDNVIPHGNEVSP